MFRRTKELEQRVKSLEDIVRKLVQEKQQEEEFLNPPVMGGRRSNDGN